MPHARQARDNRLATLARIERRLQHARHRVIGHGNQTRRASGSSVNDSCTLPLRCEQLAEARPRLATTPVPSAHPMLLHQPGRLQRLFQKAIRNRDAVVPPRNLMKVAHIEALIPLPIQPEQPLDLRRRHPPHRGRCHRLSTSPTDRLLIPLAPPSQRPRRPPQDVRRPKPVPLAAEGLQHHFLTVIARSHAASGYDIEPPQLCLLPAALEADR